MCLGGMRCAALAYQPCERGSLPTIKEPRNLVLLAIIGRGNISSTHSKT